MEINYIILAHKNPLQVERLISRLNGPQICFYIHIDKSVSIKPFLKKIKGDKIYFLDENQRQNGTWGDIGIVKATLIALEKIIRDRRSGYCVLLSGQDYPLSDSLSIKNFFQQNYGTHYIDIFKMPGIWGGLAKKRLNFYKINHSKKRGDFFLLPSIYSREFYSIENMREMFLLWRQGKFKVLQKILKKREFPPYLEAYGGTAYWSFPIETVKDILKFTKEHPKFLAYHNFSLCADEIFFHSILMHFNRITPLKIAPSLTLINWYNPEGPPPLIFTTSHFDLIKKAGNKKFFARKFDTRKDSNILELIDRKLIRK